MAINRLNDDATATARRIDPAIVWFFVIAYGIAWTIWVIEVALADAAGMETTEFINDIEGGRAATIESDLPGWMLYLMTRVQDFSFTIAGLIMISATTGRLGWRELGSRLTRWRIPLRWYALGLLPILLYGGAALLASSGEGGSAVVEASTIRTILFSLSAGLFVSLFLRGAMGEELGLRGFALPRLQQRTTPARASLIIGIGWALWHLPVLLDRNPAEIVILLLLIVGLSFLFTWLFNGSGGSLIPPLLFHATQNWEEGFETVFPAIVGTDWETPAALALLATSAFAVFAVRRPTGGSGVPAEEVLGKGVLRAVENDGNGRRQQA